MGGGAQVFFVSRDWGGGGGLREEYTTYLFKYCRGLHVWPAPLGNLCSNYF